MQRFTVLAVFVGLAAGCGHSGKPLVERPAWVNTAVSQIRGRFDGNPEPRKVTWGVTPVRRWVTVLFAKTETCSRCSHGPGGGVVKGRRSTVTFADHSQRAVEFSIHTH